jgi:hypothetical protein
MPTPTQSAQDPESNIHLQSTPSLVQKQHYSQPTPLWNYTLLVFAILYRPYTFVSFSSNTKVDVKVPSDSRFESRNTTARKQHEPRTDPHRL